MKEVYDFSDILGLTTVKSEIDNTPKLLRKLMNVDKAQDRDVGEVYIKYEALRVEMEKLK